MNIYHRKIKTSNRFKSFHFIHFEFEIGACNTKLILNHSWLEEEGRESEFLPR